MRTDALVPIKAPEKAHGNLPIMDFPSEILDIDTQWMDGIADLIAYIHDAETDEDFDSRLTDLERCTEATGLGSTADPLGIYDPRFQRVTIDDAKIHRCAESMRTQQITIEDGDLLRVVEIHEDSHALHHLAVDSHNNEIWLEFPYVSLCLLEILAQLFTHYEVEKDARLLKCFF